MHLNWLLICIILIQIIEHVNGFREEEKEHVNGFREEEEKDVNGSEKKKKDVNGFN